MDLRACAQEEVSLKLAPKTLRAPTTVANDARGPHSMGHAPDPFVADQIQ